MYTVDGTKWPFMYWCAVKKLLTHSLTHTTQRLEDIFGAYSNPGTVYWVKYCYVTLSWLGGVVVRASDLWSRETPGRSIAG